jgi:Zn-dependent metalloprotease
LDPRGRDEEVAMARGRRCLNCIMPPHILHKLLDSGEAKIKDAALGTLLTTARLRGERRIRSFAGAVGSSPSAGRRTIYDCAHSVDLAASAVVRSEKGPASADVAVNRAFEGLGATREFYRTVLSRDSIDDKGMRLDGYVHRGQRYNNAFWDGQEMVFGDGDGYLFTDFTGSLDVIGHELTHGVTEFSAGLEYHNQSGALNESISDVFGSLVKQWSNKQPAAAADWLIGADIFTPETAADALRSMKAPGTAYDNEEMGKDPQPGHMRDYAQLADTEEEDNGGVHINSGIPNRAFYLAAVGVGGNAWDEPGHVWYEALKASSPTTDFQGFADNTYMKAIQLYGSGSQAQKAVVDAWKQVGINITATILAGDDRAALGAQPEPAGPEDIASQLVALAEKVRKLSAGA